MPPPPTDLGRVQVSGALPAAGTRPWQVHWPWTPRKRRPPAAPPAASPKGGICSFAHGAGDVRPADS